MQWAVQTVVQFTVVTTDRRYPDRSVLRDCLLLTMCIFNNYFVNMLTRLKDNIWSNNLFVSVTDLCKFCRLVIKEHVKTMRWHLVPLKHRRLWSRLINRADSNFRITDNTQVCSNHFILGQPLGQHQHLELHLKGYVEATNNFSVHQILH